MAALAAISIGSASAEIVYVTGSTAFRSAANGALNTYATTHGGAIIAADNSTLGSAGNLILSYTNGGGTNYINVHWSGSEAGIQSCAGPTTGSNAQTIGFLPNSYTGTNTAYSSQNTNYQVADLTFSDTFQSSSSFAQGKFNGVNYSALTGATTGAGNGIVGVVTFTWVASAGAPITNVTANGAKNLLAQGGVSQALFTGNSADQTAAGYFLVGRNVDSGTRLTTLAESGYGIKTGVVQYQVDSTNMIEPYPTQTIDGIVASTGNGGYSSGGTLCGYMTNHYASNLTNDTTGDTSEYSTNYLIGYAGVSDANGKVSGGLVELAYNGVAFSTNAVAQGQYTFWGYEHLYIGAAADSTAIALANAVGSSVYSSTTATLNPNVNFSDVNNNVGRTSDGTPVYQNY